MLEYLGERLFSKTEEYAIFGSVAGWECEITGTEVKVNRTTDKGITLGAIECSSCKRTFIDPEQEKDFCLLSDSDSESVEPQMLCPNCKNVSAMPVYGGHKIPNIGGINLAKLLVKLDLQLVVPYGDSNMDPLRTRTSYCNALKVYLVITPSDKKILDEFNKYRAKMTETDITDFDTIILKTFELKNDIYQYIEKSYFSVWRRIWLLHERWVAQGINLSVCF